MPLTRFGVSMVWSKLLNISGSVFSSVKMQLVIPSSKASKLISVDLLHRVVERMS